MFADVHNASFAFCMAMLCLGINTTVLLGTQVSCWKVHFRKQFWCFGIVLSIHRILKRCLLLKDDAFWDKRMVSASLFHMKVLCRMSLVVTFIQDSSYVITDNNKLGVFWEVLQLAGQQLCWFVSGCHVGHLEPILCTIVPCLISLICGADHFPLACLTWQTVSSLSVFCLSSAVKVQVQVKVKVKFTLNRPWRPSGGVEV